MVGRNNKGIGKWYRAQKIKNGVYFESLTSITFDEVFETFTDKQKDIVLFNMDLIK